MKTSLKRVSRPQYSVIGDGSVSHSDLGEGRFIPALIIDAEPRSEVGDLIEIHQGTTGDVVVQWGRPFGFFKPKIITLEIRFKNPMEIQFAIQFDLKTQAILVDGIIQSRGFYLQRGEIGDRVSEGSKNKILVEVPDVGFDSHWETQYRDLIKDKVNKKNKTKKEVNLELSVMIKESRKLWHIRRK